MKHCILGFIFLFVNCFLSFGTEQIPAPINFNYSLRHELPAPGDQVVMQLTVLRVIIHNDTSEDFRAEAHCIEAFWHGKSQLLSLPVTLLISGESFYNSVNTFGSDQKGIIAPNANVLVLCNYNGNKNINGISTPVFTLAAVRNDF
jgi:hypothetical protein